MAPIPNPQSPIPNPQSPWNKNIEFPKNIIKIRIFSNNYKLFKKICFLI